MDIIEGREVGTPEALEAFLNRVQLADDGELRNDIARKIQEGLQDAEGEEKMGEVWWGSLLRTMAEHWYLREPVDECVEWPYGYMMNDADGWIMREFGALASQAEMAYEAKLPPTLKARVAEFIASHCTGEQRKHWMGEVFDAYMACPIPRTDDDEHWHDHVNRLQRAGAIGEHEQIRRDWRKLLAAKAVSSLKPEEEAHDWSWHVVQAVQGRLKRGDHRNVFIEQLTKEAGRKENAEDWLSAHDTWLLMAEVIGKNTPEQRETLQKAAKCTAQEGERRGQEDGGKLAGAHWFEQAAETMREVIKLGKNAQTAGETIENLQGQANRWEHKGRRLTESGLATETMVVHGTPVDMSREILSIKTAIVEEAELKRIWKWMKSWTQSQYEAQADAAHAARGALWQHIPRSAITRRMESGPTLVPGTPGYKRELVVREVCQTQECQAELLSRTMMLEIDEGTKEAICDEIHRAVEQADLVAAAQRKTVHEALACGVRGVWRPTCYMLTPLVEEMLKREIERHGHTAKKTNRLGEQELRTLPGTIEHARECELLDQETAFEMNAIMASRSPEGRGDDMRNIVCHGTATDGDSGSWYAVWLWATVLRWVDQDAVHR